MLVCLSVGGPTTFSLPSRATSLLVGTVNGIVVLENKNKQWISQNTFLQGQHIHALLSLPETKHIFAGIYKGSIYMSADAGHTWQLRDNGLTEKNVYSLNCNQVDGRPRLYAGTEPAHLFESIDLGESWREFNSLQSVPSVPQWTFPAPPHHAHVKYVGFDPQNAKTIYACVEQGGLFRSKDGGTKWEELHGFDSNLPFDVPDGAAADDVHRIVIKQSDPTCLYISGGVGVCRSRDAGVHWEHLMPPQSRIGYPDALLMHPHQENVMFTAGASQNPKAWRTSKDANAAIARSRNGGETWELLPAGLPEHLQSHVAAMALAVWNGSSALFAGTTAGEIFCSENEGDKWEQIAQVAPISKAGHYISLGAGAKSKVA